MKKDWFVINKRTGKLKSPETPIKLIKESLTQHLESNDIDYIFKGIEVGFSSRRDFSLWLRSVINRIDEKLDKTTIIQIMEENGKHCYEMNKHTDPYKSDFQRLSHYESINDFIRDHQSYGKSLFLNGNVVALKYSPPKWKHGVKCWCLNWRGLKSEETVSSSWCHCSKGLITEHWKQIAHYFDQDVSMRMECSCIAGAEDCKFKIVLKKK